MISIVSECLTTNTRLMFLLHEMMIMGGGRDWDLRTVLVSCEYDQGGLNKDEELDLIYGFGPISLYMIAKEMDADEVF